MDHDDRADLRRVEAPQLVCQGVSKPLLRPWKVMPKGFGEALA
jgi:hypothetical protein